MRLVVGRFCLKILEKVQFINPFTYKGDDVTFQKTDKNDGLMT